MQKFLEENNIRFRVACNPDVKAAVVERFNRMLKERMWRYFTSSLRERIRGGLERGDISNSPCSRLAKTTRVRAERLSGRGYRRNFYEQELGRVEKNLQKEEFIVKRVIKSKGRGKNKQLLVSWRDYPSKFDSWIPASSLTLHVRDEGGPISFDFFEQ